MHVIVVATVDGEDRVVALRKNKRNESLQKRRAMNVKEDMNETCGGVAPSFMNDNNTLNMSMLQNISQKIGAMNADERYQATRSVRRLLFASILGSLAPNGGVVC